MWRPKQKALYKASGVATPQDRLSREDKGKMPACFAEAIRREARTATMPSPNSGAVTPRANLVLPSDSTADTAPVPQGTREVPNRQVKTKAPSGANHLRRRQRAKHHSMLQALSSFFAAELKDRPWVLIAVLMQLQRLRVLP